MTAERRLVGYAATLTADACFVPTDHPANVGDRMRVRLALGNALEPIEVDAHVVSRRLARGPGEPGGLLLALVLMHRDEERIAKLLAGTPPEGVPIGAGAEAHVLVVDDSSLMRDILAHALRRQFRQRGRAVHIDAFATTEDAAPRLEEVGYDLVIVDYYLPGAGGADLIARVRGSARNRAASVIAISVGGNEAREATIAAGADLFVDKPLVMPQIAATIDRLISERTAS